MPLKINVPFSEKDIVKNLGARWDPNNKTWYVPDNVVVTEFKRWWENPKTDVIAKKLLYIALTTNSCWKCGHQTPVISLFSKKFMSLEVDCNDELVWENWESSFFDYISFLQAEVASLIKDYFPHFKIGHSKTINDQYWVNHCKHCSFIQGDHFLHNQPGIAFFPINEISAQRITLIELPLQYDVELRCSFSFSTSNELIERFAKKVTLEDYKHTFTQEI